MKNITALAVLVIILNSAYCQEPAEYPPDLPKERNYHFSIGPQAGFVYGQASEYVYPTDTKGEFLSELRWDMKSVFYLGAQIDFGLIDIMKRPGFFASLSFAGGIPGDSGKMEDRDWMSKENAELTHFSSHTNRTEEFFTLDAALGASIPLKSIYIKPFLYGSWMHFSFIGRDGYGKYPDVPRMEFMGDVISYKQDWLLISPGFSAGSKILHPLSIDLSFKISPFTYCASEDVHKAVNYKIPPDERIYKTYQRTYLDYTVFGLFLEPELTLSYSFSRIELSLDISYRYIGNTKGDSYMKTGSNYTLSGNKAGAGLSLLNSRFLVKLIL